MTVDTCCKITTAILCLLGCGFLAGGIYGLVHPIDYYPATGLLLNCTEQMVDMGEYSVCQVTAWIECKTIIDDKDVSSIRQVLAGGVMAVKGCADTAFKQVWADSNLYRKGEEWWCSEVEIGCPRSVGGWGTMLGFGCLFILIAAIIVLVLYYKRKSEYQAL